MSTTTTNTPNSAPIAVYLWAGNEIIQNVTPGNFYFHDGRGNVTHLIEKMRSL